MNLHNGLGDREIKEVIIEHPEIGKILENYGIGCVKCSIGSCYLRDVVAVHVLGDAMEALIEKEISEYLESL